MLSKKCSSMSYNNPRHLSAKGLDELINRQLILGLRLLSTPTKYKLSIQSPRLGELPSLSNLVVDERVVMLQVGAEAISLKGSPDQALVHGSRLRGPVGEFIGIEGKLLLELLGGVFFGEEQNGAGSAFEESQLVAGRLPLILGDDGLEGVGGDVPEAVVLGAKEDNGADGLRVEGGGCGQERILDDLLDVGVGDAGGEGLGEDVVGATASGEVEEGLRSVLDGHCDWFLY